MPGRCRAGVPRRSLLASSGPGPMRAARYQDERIPSAGPLWLALPDQRPSMPIANCKAGSSRSRAAGQRSKPDRPRPPLRPSAPPFPPPSTAGGAQPRSPHPLHALLLDSPEGLSFPQHAAVGHSQQAGSDRTLTLRWTGELQHGPLLNVQNNILVNPDNTRVIARIVSAVAPYPDARAAVIAALRDLDTASPSTPALTDRRNEGGDR